MTSPVELSAPSIRSVTPPSLSPSEIMERTRAREAALSRLLMAYIGSGLFFMLLPGTFLGVWNLVQISGNRSAASVAPSWLQAHGHAQVFGWVGSFILGIGYYSVPKFRNLAKPSFGLAWACWIAWTLGVAARWFANVYQWQWRSLLPISAALELAAFLIFFRAVSQHTPDASPKNRLEPWIWVVVTGSLGLLASLAFNLGACIELARHSSGPALPHALDQRFLVLIAWGFLVPFVWGFSSKWLPVFLGLKPLRPSLLFVALAMNLTGIVLTFAGYGDQATPLFVLAVAFAIAALRIFEPALRRPKTRGVHFTFPFFIRVAYAWLLVAALLGVAAALWDSSGGIWGASRHALTVGFIAVMVLCIGQRVLPAFAGMRLLWSTRLMFAGLLLLTVGCTIRVSAEMLAYQGYAHSAWALLPGSAMLELAGITAFAANMFATFFLEPSHAYRESATLETSELKGA